MLRTIHRWLGLPLGLLLLITFGSGLLTAISELMSRAPQSQSSYREPDLAAKAQAISLISNQHQNIRQLMMPSEAMPYYQVRLDQQTVIYSLDNLTAVADQELPMREFFKTVLQLHRNFLLGKTGFLGIAGAHYVAWVSLLSLLISVLGLWLWWPLRSTFKLKKLIPRCRKRRAFYYSHLNTGVLIGIALMLLSITGASITYRTITQQLLGVAGHKIDVLEQPIELTNSWHSWLSAIDQEMPNATLIRIQFPRQNHSPTPSDNFETVKATVEEKPKRILTFRLVSQDDWLGLPNSKIQIDAESSAILSHAPFKDLPTGAKIMAVVVPLHTGRGLPKTYVVLLLLVSVLGTLMVFSGVASFLMKKRRRINTKMTVARV